MPWSDGLFPGQARAAAHSGRHARVLAGPGTGKTLTLTRHVCYLIAELRVPSEGILVVTFTRAAAAELRQRLERQLGVAQRPDVLTLHSFALRQLLRNSEFISDLPRPLRIADDWEERYIVQEDLKALLGLSRIREVRDLLHELSADWQSLTADEQQWEQRFPNPRFLGAWREHRSVYGYTLRDELVYQLKKMLEQRSDCEIVNHIRHLVVDEYQDLNRCDLAVVHEIASRNAELYVAGDDDQSIYGFRKAHPEGIRRFLRDYPGSRSFPLEVCKRCDCEILDMGLFVARQDPRRIEKEIATEEGREQGEVAILRFADQEAEAQGIAGIVDHLLEHHGLQHHDILVLLRSDHNSLLSAPIQRALEEAGIPVHTATETSTPLDSDDGRVLLAFMRLAVDGEDSLAWRTILSVWSRGIGTVSLRALYDLARRRGMTFAETIRRCSRNTEELPGNLQLRISDAAAEIISRLTALFPEDTRGGQTSTEALLAVVGAAASLVIDDADLRQAVLDYLRGIAEGADSKSVADLIRAVQVASQELNQDIEQGRVNILTMHRAKGLTARAVIVAAAEDEYIPGRAQGDAIDDERRLLFVSLTRAEHHLFVTYCEHRLGVQMHTGRTSGTTERSLTHFLDDAPHRPRAGVVYVRRMERAEHDST